MTHPKAHRWQGSEQNPEIYQHQSWATVGKALGCLPLSLSHKRIYTEIQERRQTGRELLGKTHNLHKDGGSKACSVRAAEIRSPRKLFSNI